MIRQSMLATFVLMIVTSMLPWARSAVALSNNEGPEISQGEITQGTLMIKTPSSASYSPAPVLDTDVTMDVSGLIARVKVVQKFRNEGQEWAEGKYTFPLPDNAAVDHMRLIIGSRIIEGQIHEREKARKIYQTAKRQGKQTSLLEQQRANIFTTLVANIAPNDAITVEIEYQQTLTYVNSEFRLRFPLVVGPRYIPGQPVSSEQQVRGFSTGGWSVDTDQVPDASQITPPVAVPGEAPVNPVRISVSLNPGFPLTTLESSYHKIQRVDNDDGSYQVSLAAGNVPADRDFELRWRPVQGSEPQAALFRQRLEGEDYAMLMVLPPSDAYIQQHAMPREMIFVIDVSGSMNGESIRQAKQALLLALDGLSGQDRFNIIWFNQTYGSLFPASQQVTDSRIRTARGFVSKLRAEGGTEMSGALKMALSKNTEGTHLRQVVFLTDGAVGNERALFKTISSMIGDSRLFTVGIGSAPNSHFMKKAARAGRGTFTFIGKTSEVLRKIQALLEKLEHPALSNLRLSFSNGQTSEIYPYPIPDLYKGEPVIVAMKTRQLSGSLEISGKLGNLSPWRSRIALSGGEQHPGIARLWARRKIDSLIAQGVGARGESGNDTIRQQIIQIAMQHHLVSKYTSLVAVDVTPVRKDAPVYSHAMKTNLPQGWSYKHVFGMPQTATPALQKMLIGLALLLLSLMFIKVYQWQRY
ncbi:MAG: marine proteobacterial sortase target protein [Gammaproteobacteria bacterium]|nr:MAG: marine proteobacterial sortase target protein [Gammaproteobacteria bacterium]